MIETLVLPKPVLEGKEEIRENKMLFYIIIAL